MIPAMGGGELADFGEILLGDKLQSPTKWLVSF